MRNPIRITKVPAQSSAQRVLLFYLNQEIFTYEDGFLEAFVKDSAWWLAWDGDEPVGFAGIGRAKQWDNCGYFYRAGVLKSHRGRGIQQMLIAARLRECGRRGYSSCITTTYGVAASTNNLIKAGFRAFSPEEPWMSEGTTYWVKYLKGTK